MTREITADLTDVRARITGRPAYLRAVAVPAPRPAPPAPAPRPGRVEWPRNAYADWYPQPIPTAPPAPDMIAMTVFTTFRPPVAPGADPLYAATCVCGHAWHSTSEAFMRRELAEHSCMMHLGHPAGLLPAVRDVDDLTDDALGRLLDGLRRLP